MIEPTRVRASALSGYPDCCRRTAARLFPGEIGDAGFRLRRTPRGIGAAIGTAVHEAARQILGDVALGRQLPAVAIAQEIAAVSLAGELGRGEILFDDTTANRDEAVGQATRMAGAYHRVIAPDVRPILVEERLEAEIAPGLVLSGQPDTVAREPGMIRDLKSGSRTRPASFNAQVGAYSLLLRSARELQVDEACIDYVQRVIPSRAQPDPISKAVPIAAAETAAARILAHVESDLRCFREGDPARRILPGDPWSFLANPESILCSPKYCPAHGTDFCREWQEK